MQTAKRADPIAGRKIERTEHLAYLAVVAALGAAAVGLSLYRVVSGGGYQWILLAYGTVLTGTLTIVIPGVNSKLSVSDAFVFINTILFGTAAGVLTAAAMAIMLAAVYLTFQASVEKASQRA